MRSVALLFVLALTSCGGAPVPASPPVTTPAPEQVVAAKAPPASAAPVPEGPFPGCDEAAARYRAAHPAGSPELPEIILSGYVAVLHNQRALDACNAAPSPNALIEVCAAVEKGRAVGATVAANPPDEATSACLVKQIRELRFPPFPGFALVRATLGDD